MSEHLEGRYLFKELAYWFRNYTRNADPMAVVHNLTQSLNGLVVAITPNFTQRVNEIALYIQPNFNKTPTPPRQPSTGLAGRFEMHGWLGVWIWEAFEPKWLQFAVMLVILILGCALILAILTWGIRPCLSPPMFEIWLKYCLDCKKLPVPVHVHADAPVRAPGRARVRAPAPPKAVVVVQKATCKGIKADGTTCTKGEECRVRHRSYNI